MDTEIPYFSPRPFVDPEDEQLKISPYPARVSSGLWVLVCVFFIIILSTESIRYMKVDTTGLDYDVDMELGPYRVCAHFAPAGEQLHQCDQLNHLCEVDLETLGLQPIISDYCTRWKTVQGSLVAGLIFSFFSWWTTLLWSNRATKRLTLLRCCSIAFPFVALSLTIASLGHIGYIMRHDTMWTIQPGNDDGTSFKWGYGYGLLIANAVIEGLALIIALSCNPANSPFEKKEPMAQL